MKKNYNFYNKDEVKKRLRTLRETHGMTQSELVSSIEEFIGNDLVLEEGKGVSAISSLENGKRMLSYAWAYGYSKVFNVTLDYLYGLSELQSNYNNLDDLKLSAESIKIIQDWSKIESNKFYKKPGEFDLYVLDFLLTSAALDWNECKGYSIFGDIGLAIFSNIDSIEGYEMIKFRLKETSFTLDLDLELLRTALYNHVLARLKDYRRCYAGVTLENKK